MQQKHEQWWAQERERRKVAQLSQARPVDEEAARLERAERREREREDPERWDGMS